jgi:methylmalonyl-CoA mutase N-terminal domain/subunit
MQIANLRSIRENRGKISEKLAGLKEAAEQNRNLMPIVIDCVESHVTIGEICDVLRDVFGEYKENITL